MPSRRIILIASLIGITATAFGQVIELPQTGQTTIYAVGDDADVGAGIVWPDPRFTDNGDGTVTDNLTGLVWLQNANCYGLLTWTTALATAAALADGECGLTDGSVAGDWRVPNANELASLANAAEGDLASWLIGQGFAGVQAAEYQSSTTYAAAPASAWNVNLLDGGSGVSTKDTVTNFFLMVRGTSSGPAVIPRTGQATCSDGTGTPVPCPGTGQDGDVLAGAAWPPPRFTDNGDGTITDNLTSLVWLQDAGCLGERTWAAALAAVSTLATGDAVCGLGDGSAAGAWRLPNIRELRSLGDLETRDPALTPGHPFTNVPIGNTDFYWSGTTYAGDTGNAWYVASRFWWVGNTAKGFALWTWAVRDVGGGGGGTQVDLPQTGQTTCYDGAGNVSVCAGSGQDGDLLTGVAWPAPRFTDNLDGSVTDNLTGLIWLQDASCFGTGTFAAALADANGLATGSCGLSDGSATGDWRLPNVNELVSLINAGESAPAAWLNSQAFANAQAVQYWSSTNVGTFGNSAYFADLSNGAVAWGGTASAYTVWPVRGTTSGPAKVWQTGQTNSFATGDDGDIQAGVAWPDPRFTDNSDGTVTDNLTGLLWLKEANCAGGINWTNALTAAAALADGQCGLTDGSVAGDWRLPNIRELYSLVEYTQSNPPLITGHPFLNVQNGYWSSTTIPSSPAAAYISICSWGCIDVGWTKNNALFYWPVRTPAVVVSPDITVTDSAPPNDDLSVDFGDVTVNMFADQSVTVRNDGSADLTVGNIAVADPLAAPFSITNDMCSGQVLAPVSSCQIDVRFAPTVSGPAAPDSFDIPSDDPDENPVTVTVTGNGTPVPVPDIIVTDAVPPNDNLSVDFGDVTVNTLSSPETVTVTNGGTADLTLGDVAVADALAAPFSITNDMCSGQVLTPTASCTFGVRFAPTGTGPFNDSLDIPSNDPDENPVVVTVIGNGTPAPVPDITVTDSIAPADDLSVGFGNVTENTAADETVTVTNDGDGVLMIGNVAVNNPLAAPFSVVNDTCSQATLDPAASCTFGVRFAPTGTGPFNDSLDIPSSDPDESTVTVDVSGTGTPSPVPDIVVTDAVAPLDDLDVPFGNVMVGDSAGQTVTVANAGNDDLALGDVAVANPLAAPFGVLNDGCSGNTLAPASSCTFDVRFAPTATGPFNDSLDIPSDDPDESTVTVNVSGTGTPMPVPDIAVTDSLAPAGDLQLPFADLTVGGQAEETISISNDGTADLTLGNIAMANPLAEPFSIVGDSCSAPALAPGASCSLTVRFAPAAAGTFNDSLDIPSDDPDENPVTVSVSGTGLGGANNPPSRPLLLYPANGQTRVPTTVTFEWRPSTDPDGDPVTYAAYNCTDPDPINACPPTEVGTVANRAGVEDGGIRYAGLGLGGGSGLLALVMLVALRGRRKLPLLTILVVLSATLLGSCLNDGYDGPPNASYTLSGLQSGRIYYWAIVAKDGNGGETPSEVWAYTTR